MVLNTIRELMAYLNAKKIKINRLDIIDTTCRDGGIEWIPIRIYYFDDGYKGKSVLVSLGLLCNLRVNEEYIFEDVIW